MKSMSNPNIGFRLTGNIDSNKNGIIDEGDSHNQFLPGDEIHMQFHNYNPVHESND